MLPQQHVHELYPQEFVINTGFYYPTCHRAVWILVSFSSDLFIFQYYLSRCSILYLVVLKYKNWRWGGIIFVRENSKVHSSWAGNGIIQHLVALGDEEDVAWHSGTITCCKLIFC